jgi:hypothetical protein
VLIESQITGARAIAESKPREFEGSWLELWLGDCLQSINVNTAAGLAATPLFRACHLEIEIPQPATCAVPCRICSVPRLHLHLSHRYLFVFRSLGFSSDTHRHVNATNAPGCGPTHGYCRFLRRGRGRRAPGCRGQRRRLHACTDS